MKLDDFLFERQLILDNTQVKGRFERIYGAIDNDFRHKTIPRQVSISTANKVVNIFGWIINDVEKCAFESIHVCIGDIVYTADILGRPDVAKAYGDQYLYSGFYVRIPLSSAYAEGKEYTVKIFGIAKDNRCYVAGDIVALTIGSESLKIDMDQKYHYETLCDMLGIGNLIEGPLKAGGFNNTLYAIKTTLGVYAVKTLNPASNIESKERAEEFAAIAAKKVPTAPAKKIKGSFVHELEGQHYIVYDWVDGIELPRTMLTSEHCNKIGRILADIHNINSSGLVGFCAPDIKPWIDWASYLRQGKARKAQWIDELEENIDYLYRIYSRSAEAAFSLHKKNMVVSHWDLSPGNVLWKGDNPIVVDWESANLASPSHNFITTALYWTASCWPTNDTDDFDKDKFFAFAKGYQDHRELTGFNWNEALHSVAWGLLRMAEGLFIESLRLQNYDEKQLQIYKRVPIILQAIIHYEKKMDVIEEWLNEIQRDTED